MSDLFCFRFANVTKRALPENSLRVCVGREYVVGLCGYIADGLFMRIPAPFERALHKRVNQALGVKITEHLHR